MDYPATYKYTKEHEWIELSGSEGKVGITDYAQNSLGDIVFVDLPKVGSSVEKGKVFGSVESVKAVSDLYSPVSGKVTAVNEELTSSPEKINTDAHNVLDHEDRSRERRRCRRPALEGCLRDLYQGRDALNYGNATDTY